jgi:hypothetical protein
MLSTCLMQVSQWLGQELRDFVPDLLCHKSQEQLINAPQLISGSGWLNQAGADPNEVRNKCGSLGRSPIIKDLRPDVTKRCKSPDIDSLLDLADFCIRERPRPHRRFEVGSIEPFRISNGGRQIGQRSRRDGSCCLLDRVVERLDDKGLVRRKEGQLEIAGSCKVMVK